MDNIRGDTTKFDAGKPMWDLLDLKVIERIVEVLTYGAHKYAPNGWRSVPDADKRYHAALMRHLAAYQSGEYFDEETGLTHLAHAACNIYFLLAFEQGKLYDTCKRIEIDQRCNTTK